MRFYLIILHEDSGHDERRYYELIVRAHTITEAQIMVDKEAETIGHDETVTEIKKINSLPDFWAGQLLIDKNIKLIWNQNIWEIKKSENENHLVIL